MLIARLVYQFKKNTVYPSYLFNEIIGNFIFPIFINLMFWNVIIQKNDISYTLPQMFAYLFFSNFTYSIIGNDNLPYIMEKDIKTYRLGKKLLWPQNYLLSLFLDLVSQAIVKMIIMYLPLLFLFSIFYNPVNILQILEFAIVLSIGFFINYLTSCLVGTLSFFLTEIWGINAMKYFIFYILSGALFPFDILPDQIYNILQISPVSYICYYPAKIVSDAGFSITGNYYLFAAIWIFVLSTLLHVIWRRGLKKYENNTI